MARPLMIICETVNACTNDCIICPYGVTKREKGVMPLALFEKVLQDYSAMGGGKLSLTPKLGELFLDPILKQRLECIDRYPLITGLSVTTNAVPFDLYLPEELQCLFRRFEKLYISFYGMDEEEHELITQRGFHKRVIENIKLLLSLVDKKEKVFLGFRLLKKRSEKEIREWVIQQFNEDLPFGYTYSYTRWSNDLDTTFKLPHDGIWLDPRQNREQCLRPLISQIHSNGDVSFCICNDYSKSSELYLGNIADSHLGVIINSEKNRRLWNWDKYGIPEFCRTCSIHIPLSDIRNYSYAFTDPVTFIGG